MSNWWWSFSSRAYDALAENRFVCELMACRLGIIHIGMRNAMLNSRVRIAFLNECVLAA